MSIPASLQLTPTNEKERRNIPFGGSDDGDGPHENSTELEEGEFLGYAIRRYVSGGGIGGEEGSQVHDGRNEEIGVGMDSSGSVRPGCIARNGEERGDNRGEEYGVKIRGEEYECEEGMDGEEDERTEGSLPGPETSMLEMRVREKGEGDTKGCKDAADDFPGANENWEPDSQAESVDPNAEDENGKPRQLDIDIDAAERKGDDEGPEMTDGEKREKKITQNIETEKVSMSRKETMEQSSTGLPSINVNVCNGLQTGTAYSLASPKSVRSFRSAVFGIPSERISFPTSFSAASSQVFTPEAFYTPSCGTPRLPFFESELGRTTPSPDSGFEGKIDPGRKTPSPVFRFEGELLNLRNMLNGFESPKDGLRENINGLWHGFTIAKDVMFFLSSSLKLAGQRSQNGELFEEIFHRIQCDVEQHFCEKLDSTLTEHDLDVPELKDGVDYLKNRKDSAVDIVSSATQSPKGRSRSPLTDLLASPLQRSSGEPKTKKGDLFENASDNEEGNVEVYSDQLQQKLEDGERLRAEITARADELERGNDELVQEVEMLMRQLTEKDRKLIEEQKRVDILLEEKANSLSRRIEAENTLEEAVEALAERDGAATAKGHLLDEAALEQERMILCVKDANDEAARLQQQVSQLSEQLTEVQNDREALTAKLEKDLAEHVSLRKTADMAFTAVELERDTLRRELENTVAAAQGEQTVLESKITNLQSIFTKSSEDLNTVSKERDALRDTLIGMEKQFERMKDLQTTSDEQLAEAQLQVAILTESVSKASADASLARSELSELESTLRETELRCQSSMNAEANLREQYSKDRCTLEGSMSALENELHTLEGLLHQAQGRYGELESEHEEFLLAHGNLVTQIGEQNVLLEEKNQKLESHDASHRNLEEKIKTLQDSLNVVNQEKEDITKKCAKLSNGTQKILVSYREQKEQNDALSKEVHSLTTELQKAAIDAERLRVEIHEGLDEKKKLKGELQTATADVERHCAERCQGQIERERTEKDLKNSIIQLKDLLQQAAINADRLLTEKNEKEKLAEHMKETVIHLEKNLKKAVVEVERLRSEIKESTVQREIGEATIQELHKKLNASNELVGEQEVNLGEHQRRTSQLETDVQNFRLELEEKVSKIDALRLELELIESENVSLKEQVDKSNCRDQELVCELEEKSQRVQSLEANVHRYEQEVYTLKEGLEVANKKLQNLASLPEEIVSLKKELVHSVRKLEDAHETRAFLEEKLSQIRKINVALREKNNADCNLVEEVRKDSLQQLMLLETRERDNSSLIASLRQKGRKDADAVGQYQRLAETQARQIRDLSDKLARGDKSFRALYCRFKSLILGKRKSQRARAYHSGGIASDLPAHANGDGFSSLRFHGERHSVNVDKTGSNDLDSQEELLRSVVEIQERHGLDEQEKAMLQSANHELSQQLLLLQRTSSEVESGGDGRFGQWNARKVSGGSLRSLEKQVQNHEGRASSLRQK